MPFLTVNGITIPVKDQSSSAEHVREGENGASMYARDFLARKGTGLEIGGTIPLQSPDMAESFAGIIGQRGHWFLLEADAWSDTGFGPVNGDYTFAAGGMTGWSGTMLLPDVGIATQWDLGIGDRWTIGWSINSRTTGNSIGWFTQTSDGRLFINGTYSTTGNYSEKTIANGRLSLSASFGHSQMVLLNFVASDEHISNIYSRIASIEPFPMRYLVVDGTVNTYLASRPRNMIGEVSNIPYNQGRRAGVWHNNLQDVEFSLKELEVYY